MDYAGASECLECPAGRWSDLVAMTVCSQCAAGAEDSDSVEDWDDMMIIYDSNTII